MLRVNRILLDPVRITIKMVLKAFLPFLLTSLIVATPTSMERRQYISADDLDDGNCKDVMFLFARGSTELGNEVNIVSFA